MNVLERIACRNFVVAKGFAYFSSWFYNGLYKVEIETGKTVFLGYFEEEKISQRNIHKEIFLKNDKIFLCPWKGRYLHILSLSDQSLCSIEIREKDEKIFSIDEIIFGERSVFFLSDNKDGLIKKMDFQSLKVTKINEKIEMQGIAISKNKDIFPFSELMGKSGIEWGDQFFWRQVSDRVWYSFYPRGRHMLRYAEGTDKLEMIPLIIENKRELDEYLHKVKREVLVEYPVESILKIQDLLKDIKAAEICRTDSLGGDGNIGKGIWKEMTVNN